MSLKPVVTSLEGLDENVSALYKEKSDGSFVLDIDGNMPGTVAKIKVDEFRENNIDLLRKLETLENKYDGVDVDEFTKLKAAELAAKDKKMIDAGKLDELLEERTERMRQEHESQVGSLTKASDKFENESINANAQLAKLLIDAAVSAEVGKLGAVRQGAMDDILARARRDWKLVEGKPMAMNPDGETPKYGEDGKSHLTMTEWATDLVATASFLFESTSGGGSGGGVQQSSHGEKVIDGNNNDAFLNNLDKIASGDVKVQ